MASLGTIHVGLGIVRERKEDPPKDARYYQYGKDLIRHCAKIANVNVTFAELFSGIRPNGRTVMKSLKGKKLDMIIFVNPDELKLEVDKKKEIAPQCILNSGLELLETIPIKMKKALNEYKKVPWHKQICGLVMHTHGDLQVKEHLNCLSDYQHLINEEWNIAFYKRNPCGEGTSSFALGFNGGEILDTMAKIAKIKNPTSSMINVDRKSFFGGIAFACATLALGLFSTWYVSRVDEA